MKSGWLRPATRTPLNPDLGPNRRFDWTDTSLADIKEIRSTFGGSVNDVVLAIAAGAIRRFLSKQRSFDLEGVEFRAMNPVSTRRNDQRGALGNQVAMWLVTLPVDDAEPGLPAREDQGRDLQAQVDQSGPGSCDSWSNSPAAPR